MLQRLKELNVDRLLDVDEAVSLSAFARAQAAEYEELGLPVPGWLEKSTDVLREEIAWRTRASDLAELKRLETELEGMKTLGERKTDTQKKLAALQGRLGLSTAKSGR